eukprot:5472546-Pleurochrysis_carterae.AAC.1
MLALRRWSPSAPATDTSKGVYVTGTDVRTDVCALSRFGGDGRAAAWVRSRTRAESRKCACAQKPAVRVLRVRDPA